jgi:dTDP-4-dehydrorhamnose reductase
MNSKILVTGAHGQLGNELNVLSPMFKNQSFVFIDKVNLDITDEAALSAFIYQEKFTAVINCAAYTAVDKAESEKDIAFKVNADAAGYLAKACNALNARFIHISTDFVFDGTIARPLREDDKVNPLSIYGASKLDGELQVFKYNPQTLMIRTAWVYSSFGGNFVKTILRLCKERESINVIYDQVGTPTYARNLSEAILRIVTSADWKPGIYNYSNEGIASWYDFAIAIRNIAGLKTQINPIETVQYPTPAARPKYSVLNKRKIKETFGLQIPYWHDSLEACMKLL